VIVSQEGHVLTNWHVIVNQREIQITLYNGKKYAATLIGQDPQLDVAVLRIEAQGEKFRPLKFGDSSQVRLGQMVFAIGNPFGLGETVTRGIVSAVERSLSDTERDLFQTDAAINPGNSGGPLVSVQGEIIGINKSIYSPDRANPGFQGVGFSIPSNDVKDALTAILERGAPLRGYLGLAMENRKDAVEVISVKPGGPAEAAGLKEGDVVATYDGEAIRSREQLRTLVQRTRIGRKVPLSITREGQQLNLEATIAESQPEQEPAQPQPPQSRTQDTEEILRAIGIQVRDLNEQERQRFGVNGVVVERVSSSGLAYGRLKPGDLINSVNRNEVRTALEFLRHLVASAGVQPTNLAFFREGKYYRTDLPAVPRKEGE
jgi:serine protease Do